MLKADMTSNRGDDGLATGVAALQFLAGDPDLTNRFLSLSGLEAHELREAATQPAFFAGLLDFMLADERTLLSFCESAQLRPDAVVSARTHLSRSYGAADPA
ncbi:DUF3572 domain-containing protein [Aureimonas mangrovi]|uniref:DUF3572 domain-containing protein n=1 Tax=Aureimonas mangrovi TaxID=2758041 RepID=UPI00163D9022|nr:DUF3572 domain-containing protein [Aureimonas mangrovi]